LVHEGSTNAVGRLDWPREEDALIGGDIDRIPAGSAVTPVAPWQSGRFAEISSIQVHRRLVWRTCDGHHQGVAGIGGIHPESVTVRLAAAPFGLPSYSVIGGDEDAPSAMPV